MKPPAKIKGWPNLPARVEELRQFSIKSRIIEAEPYNLDEGPDGTQLVFEDEAGEPVNSSPIARAPFKLYIRPKPGSEGNYEGGIEYYSGLFDSLQPDDKLTITGLLSEDRATGWRDVIANDAFWLTVIFDSVGAVASATINSWGDGDEFNLDEPAWSGNDGYCEDDEGTPPVHQTSRILLAYTIAGSAGQPVPWQLVTSHLVLRDVVIDARYARYPFPHSGGYLH